MGLKCKLIREDWTKKVTSRTINVASRVLTRENAPPHCGHNFQQPEPFWKSFKISLQQIFYYSHIMKNAPPHGGKVFQPNQTIFKILQDIIGTNFLTKSYEERTINVTSREKCPALCTHVFQPTGTIFKLVQYIIGTNLLTKFHYDRTINVASRVLTRFYFSHISRIFQPTGPIIELIQDIIPINLFTKFHKDQTNNVASRMSTRKNAPPPGAHVFQPTGSIF
ncbi:hypothetical protein DPMN_026682 [Dreissena polymorpha]|uniref:Uncharacterized protein n=1 Tax=Dreissena polymorpha TaxID=45954 RepID=A0A9D4LRL4_DREPO|nr:hypothetical protein DPMN_026682 [Dreissena polymorpha]